MNRLSGRTALITGAARGLGRAIAEAFVREGASVGLCARSAAELAETAAELRGLAAPGAAVEAWPADISSPDEVRAFANRAFARFGRIEILVNNAGIYGPMGPSESADWDAWVEAVQINLMGSVLMCRALLPHFRQNMYGKIIQLSGGGATAPLPGISAYAASKAAVVRFAETLALETADAGIDVNSIAPGALNTRLLDEVLEAGPDKVGAAFFKKALQQKETGGTPLEKGAALAVYLASAASDGLTGKLISAIWDPWDRFEGHRKELKETDVYTLRRIVPADRGQTWDGGKP
jgi:NAD(P)-dependent dehydrogenase (short-subunit alcohol dehydrogenase family)